jgi:UPF0716 protein FxsA
MFARILLLLLVSPIIELALLIQLGNLIGFWPTMAIIVITALTGSVLLKQQGLAVWRTLQRRLGRGEMPGDQIVDGVIILVAGALLITPGVLTDFAGFAGLVPLSRIPIRKYIMRRFSRSLSTGTVSMGFGMFGGGAFDAPPYDESDTETPPDVPHWRGEGTATPGYTRPGGPPKPGKSS